MMRLNFGYAAVGAACAAWLGIAAASSVPGQAPATTGDQAMLDNASVAPQQTLTRQLLLASECMSGGNGTIAPVCN